MPARHPVTTTSRQSNSIARSKKNKKGVEETGVKPAGVGRFREEQTLEKLRIGPIG